MNISKEFENIKTRYVNFYKEPEIKKEAKISKNKGGRTDGRKPQ